MLFPIKNTLIHCPFISLLTHFPSFFLQIQQITYTFHTFPIIYSLTSTQTDLLSYAISNQKHTYPLSFYLPTHSLSFILPSNTTNNLHFPHIPIIYSLASTQTDLLSYAISNQKHTYPLSFYLPTHSLSFILPSNTTNNLHFPHRFSFRNHYTPSFPMLFPIKNTLIHCPFISLLTHFPSFFLEIQQITYTFHTFPIIYSLTSTQTDLLSYAISNQKHTYPLSFYLPTHSLSFILPSNTTNNLHFPHISHYLFPNIHTN